MKVSATLLVFACIAVPLAPAQQDADVQSKVIALEKSWNQAYKLGDTRSLDALLDDAIVLVNDDGSVQNKAEFLSSVKSSSSSQDQQVSPESIAVHVHGETAIATGIFRAKGVEGGKHYLRRERFIDTWVHKDGKWVCVAAGATSVVAH